MRLTQEFFATLSVVVFGFLLMNPFHILMSTMLHMTIFGLLLVATALFTGLLITEGSKDEREERHRAGAGRIGYMLGIIMLVVGITVQTLTHSPVDIWLIATLLVMVVGKVGTRIYKRRYE